MNAPILRLFGVFLVLFGALVALTSWNSVINAEEYRDNAKNRRADIIEQRIRRGLIRARDDTLLARSERGAEEGALYERVYPEEAELFAHAVGYSYPLQIGRAGLERSRNDALVGERNALTSIFDTLRGERQEGDNTVTNLDPDAQRTALGALQGRKGAVVAIEPATGKVRVMASVPSFDPAALDDGNTFRELSTDEENAPLVNRSTQSGYPPGSAFKVVTAAAALDSGRFEPGSVVNGNSGIEISGVPLENFGNRDFGPVTLTEALTKSVNTVWAQVAESIGGDTLDDYMRRFGFYEDPPLDYPDDQLVPSGVHHDGELVAVDEDVDVGRVAIGQANLLATPLQMAMVAAAVANDGELMKPTLTDRIVDRDGRTVDDIDPERASRVMSAASAGELTRMMANVVREGTGTAAALQGVDVAGKTGTAEIDLQGLNQPWFIGFAPTDAPKVAVAVTLERVQGGQGGEVAAPIARQVIQELLR